MSGLAYVREAYGVPARRGGEVRYCERRGVILSGQNGRLRVRLNGEKRTVILHPTWNVEYMGPEKRAAVKSRL